MCGYCHSCVICKAGIHLVSSMKKRRTFGKIVKLEDVKEESQPEVELNVQPEVKVKVKHKVDHFGNIVQYKIDQVKQHTDM
jgi:hypothetical protein